MDENNLPDAIEPTDWFVVFHTRTPLCWLGWLPIGRFKHVSAFAYCPGFKAWLVYDTQLSGTRLMLLAAATAKPALLQYMADCEVVQIKRRHRPMAWSSRAGFYCVPAIKHLLGLSCVGATPTALYRHMLRNGGVRVREPINAPASD